MWEVWGAYHERERLCPEGVRVRIFLSNAAPFVRGAWAALPHGGRVFLRSSITNKISESAFLNRTRFYEKTMGRHCTLFMCSHCVNTHLALSTPAVLTPAFLCQHHPLIRKQGSLLVNVNTHTLRIATYCNSCPHRLLWLAPLR